MLLSLPEITLSVLFLHCFYYVIYLGSALGCCWPYRLNSRFQTCPAEDLQRFASGLTLQFFTHAHTTGDSLLRSVHNSNQSSRGFRWGLVQQAEAGCNISIPLWRSCDLFIYSFYTTSASALITANSLHISVGVFYMCGSTFPSRCVLEKSSSAPSVKVNSAGNPPLCAHMGICRLHPRGPGGESLHKLQSLSLSHLGSHIHLLQRNRTGSPEFIACLKAASLISLHWHGVRVLDVIHMDALLMWSALLCVKCWVMLANWINNIFKHIKQTRRGFNQTGEKLCNDVCLYVIYLRMLSWLEKAEEMMFLMVSH